MSDAVLYDIIHIDCDGVAFRMSREWTSKDGDYIARDEMRDFRTKKDGISCLCAACGEPVNYENIRSATLRDTVRAIRKEAHAAA